MAKIKINWSTPGGKGRGGNHYRAYVGNINFAKITPVEVVGRAAYKLSLPLTEQGTLEENDIYFLNLALAQNKAEESITEFLKNLCNGE